MQKNDSAARMVLIRKPKPGETGLSEAEAEIALAHAFADDLICEQHLTPTGWWKRVECRRVEVINFAEDEPC